MNGKSYRRRGNQYELDKIHEVQDITGEKINSSRNESRTDDANGIDFKIGEWAFQCKSMDRNQPRFRELFAQMPDSFYKVVFHKQKKVDSGQEKEIAVLPKDDLLELLRIYDKYKGL